MESDRDSFGSSRTHHIISYPREGELIEPVDGYDVSERTIIRYSGMVSLKL